MGRSKDSDAWVLQRHVRILSFIPRVPRAITVSEILERLGLGKPRDRRTIERDMVALADAFRGLVATGTPRAWSWTENAQPLPFPPLRSAEALAYELCARHAAYGLGKAERDELAPLFRAAKERLDQHPAYARVAREHFGRVRSSDEEGLPSYGPRIKVRMMVEADARIPDEVKGHDAPRGRREVGFTLPNTRAALAWLRGYGPFIEVLEPRQLRQLFRDEANQAAKKYAPRGG